MEVLGRVPHWVKVELLRHAKCLVAPLAPWYFEVFGLYAVEANACGTPVAARPSGALPEVAVGALMDDVEEAIWRAVETPPQACREGASRFDYRVAWRGLLDRVKELIDNA